MGGSFEKDSEEDEEMNKYQKLLDYYKECFSLVDEFHFNSEVSKNVYKQYMPKCNGEVLSITHNGIHDNRKKKIFDKDVLHIGFVGNSTPYKGLPLLISVLQEIGLDATWDLSVWGGGIGKHPLLPVFYKGKLNASMIADVYDAMTSARVYRGALCPFEVIDTMYKDAFTKFEPKYILPFLKNVASSYINNDVRLSDGRIGKVVLINENALSLPIIQCEDEFIDLSKTRGLTVSAIL